MRTAIFGTRGESPADTPANASRLAASVATVSAVAATTTDSIDDSRAAALRNELADWIASRGTFQTPRVEQAFRTVSRHQFLPGTALETAYSRKPVVTQRAADGTPTSSASSPNLVAGMLKQLQAEPGNTILEIGAATGFNAALLASLASPAGTVVTSMPLTVTSSGIVRSRPGIGRIVAGLPTLLVVGAAWERRAVYRPDGRSPGSGSARRSAVRRAVSWAQAVVVR